MMAIATAVGCSVKPPMRRAATTPDAPKRLKLERAGSAVDAKPEPLLGVLREELDRTMRELKQRGDPPPYFVAYQATDARKVSLQAAFGALTEVKDDRRRTLDVDLRVGDYDLDNTHPVPEGEPFLGSYMRYRGAQLPLDNDAPAIRHAIWLATDKRYRNAAAQLIKVKANQAIKTDDEDKSADFSREEATRLLEPPAAIDIDIDGWKQRIKTYAQLFSPHAAVHESSVHLHASAVTRFFVSSEGSEVQIARTHVRLAFWASTTADDGMELFRYDAIDVPNAGELPPDEEIRARITRVIDDLLALREAPLAEPYEGPAIIEGEAAGVFFHEIFGHRVEGHRQKDDEEGQTFAKKLGKQVMPVFINVYDDPTVVAANGVHLNGHYRVDDEGVRAQRAALVERGVLKTFLMSRSPTRGINRSNGHGRHQAGRRIVARQANLVVEPTETTTPAKLKKLLIAEIGRQQKPYGLRFTEVAGGFTMTRRWLPQGFKVRPVMVYRVYPDGREQLVRGADLEGTPLTALTKILAAADDYAVFNGVCGAESGWVPVSSTSPSLLIEQVEIARRGKARDRPAILEPPPKGGDTTGGAP